MTSVTKSSDWEVYHVRAQHEWATIVIKGWQLQRTERDPQEVGEILVHSSFGSWAYQWGHLGKPFKQWLATMDDAGYIAAKFLGANAVEFDGPATLKALRQRLLESRREGGMRKNDARAIWDFIEENSEALESDEHTFVNVMMDCQDQADWQDPDPFNKYGIPGPGKGARYFLQEPWERISRTMSRRFKSFWTILIPPFLEQLKQELAQAQTNQKEVA